MKENTNGAIIENTVILYARLAITLVSGLFATRFALQALGELDFGLFSVVGSIIVFINVINTTMLGTSNRFIATAIGQGDPDNINKTFNVNLLIHLTMAIVTLIVAIPLGHWYISHYVNYSGELSEAITVFDISLLASAISFIGVPYNGLLIARERFLVFSLSDIFFHVFRLLACWYLVYNFTDKLLIYAIIMAITTACPIIVYYAACRHLFPDTIRPRIVKEKKMYKSILSFSIWLGYGSIVQVGQSQGSAILVNAFFNTVMNTALSVANTMKSVIMMITGYLTKPITPQLTKSYAAGDYNRSKKLLVITSKFSFLAMFLLSFPLISETEFLIKFWLGSVPEYSLLFTRLIVIDALLNTFNYGIADYIFAGGKIKTYQFWVNTILALSLVIGFVVLKMGFPAYSILYVFIAFTAFVNIVRQIILHKEYKFDNMILIKGSYIPSICVVLLSLPLFLIRAFLPPLLYLIIAEVCCFLIVMVVGLTPQERAYFKVLIQKVLSCFKH